MALWEEVYAANEKPEINVWVTIIDSDSNHRVARWTGKGWQARDINSTESPPYKEVYYWLRQIKYKKDKSK